MEKEVENKCGDLQEPVYNGIAAFQYTKYEASILDTE